MIPNRIAIAVFAAASLAFAGPAAAHHSFAMYDGTKLITITGTVKAFQWTNPHAILWLYADTDKPGPLDLWSLELSTSPGPLTRLGWTKHSLKPGDKVSADINPLRDGEHGGSLKRAILTATGQILTTSGPAPQAAPAVR